MSDTFDKFKKMMQLAKENQQRFEKELKKLEYENESSNGGEFPVGTLLTKDDSKDDTDSLEQSNQKNIDELSKLSVSSPQSTTGYLNDISRSLRAIADSMNTIEDYLVNGKETNWND